MYGRFVVLLLVAIVVVGFWVGSKLLWTGVVGCYCWSLFLLLAVVYSERSSLCF